MPRRFVITFLTILALDAHGQWEQQGYKIVGVGEVGSAMFGWSVSLSADGNAAIIGGPADSTIGLGDWFDPSCGAAWVFSRSSNLWSQQSNKLVGSGAVWSDGYYGKVGPKQGTSVSISSDGNTVIVGAAFDDGYVDDYNLYYGQGAAWVFTRIGADWNQQGSKLIGTGEVYAFQGWSVSLSSDGNTALVGGPGDGLTTTGAAWVYVRTDGVWRQQGNKLIGYGESGMFPLQGTSVCLSADGNTAIVGGPGDSIAPGTVYSSVGAAWVFSRKDSVWSQEGSKLVGTGSVGNTGQGTSVSLSADGNTAIIGGPYDDSGAGAAWVFTRSGGIWSQQGNKLVGAGGYHANQGRSVSISADAYTALIGGPQDSGGVGAVWAFTRVGSVWSQDGNKLVGTGGYYPNQGTSVSLSADGKTAIVGGPRDNSVWIFEHNPVGVDDMNERFPKHFSLLQNYPNPFNPSTTIRYELPHSSHVSLKVYNMLGQAVATLVDEIRPAGSYTVNFEGSGLASGLYFCRIEAGSFVQTRKLLLIR